MPKHKGSCVDYADQRDAFLQSVYRRLIAKCDVIRVPEIMAKVVKEPAPRYWISEQRAAEIIIEYIKGITPPLPHRPVHKRLYDSLYERYLQERKYRPDDTIAIIMFDVVNSPAPESFITPQSASVLLSRYRKRKRLKSLTNSDKDSNNSSCNNTCGAIHSNSAQSSVDDGSGNKFSDLSSSVVHDVSCFRTSSDDQLVLSSFIDIPVESKRMATVDIVRDRVARTKLYNKRYTNVRYIRSQLRIDWDNY